MWRMTWQAICARHYPTVVSVCTAQNSAATYSSQCQGRHSRPIPVYRLGEMPIQSLRAERQRSARESGR